MNRGTLRERCDPYLATIRNAIQGIDVGLGRGLTEARRNVYTALEANDLEVAMTWLDTLTDSAEAIPADLFALKAAIIRAASRIRELAREAKRVTR